MYMIAGAIFLILFAIILGLIRRLLDYQIIRRKPRYNLMDITINDIDNMNKNGRQFEDYLCVLLTAIGYKTLITQKNADYGADLIFIDSKGKKVIVQAKNNAESTTLSNDAVQQVYAALPFYKGDKGLIITSTNRISSNCRKHAAACSVNIVNRSDLKNIIKLFKKGQISAIKNILERPATIVEYSPKDLIKRPEITKTKIQSGEYFYKFITK